MYCTYSIKHTITINSLYEVYIPLLKKIVSLLLCRLHATGDAETKEDNTTVCIIKMCYPKQQGRQKRFV